MKMRSMLPLSCQSHRLIFMTLALLLATPAAVTHVARPVALPACACCADEGEWYEESHRVTSYELSEMNRIQLSQVANTYRTAADDESAPPDDTYSLAQTRKQRRWELKFKGAQGGMSQISFTIPASLTSFGADLRDGSEAGGVGPVLYKEWRLEGLAAGTGMFKKANVRRFLLVLQGRGNRCTQAEDFKNWVLQVSGRGVTYSFYGKLNEPGG